MSEIVRANSTDQAIERFISVKNIPRAECGYAYPWKQKGPTTEDWRENIRSSVTGVVIMSKKRRSKKIEKEPISQKKLSF